MDGVISQPAPAKVGGAARPVLAGFAGVIAVSAYADAVALAAGAIETDPTIEARFPFGSPVFAGVAVMLVVAVPMTVTARQAATGGRHTAGAAMAAGVLLIGWIVVEIAVIQSFHWLQPVFAAAGVVVLLAGLGWDGERGDPAGEATSHDRRS